MRAAELVDFFLESIEPGRHLGDLALDKGLKTKLLGAAHLGAVKNRRIADPVAERLQPKHLPARLAVHRDQLGSVVQAVEVLADDR